MRVCAWMRAYVRYVCVGVPHGVRACVRACVYAQIEGMVIFYFL